MVIGVNPNWWASTTAPIPVGMPPRAAAAHPPPRDARTTPSACSTRPMASSTAPATPATVVQGERPVMRIQATAVQPSADARTRYRPMPYRAWSATGTISLNEVPWEETASSARVEVNGPNSASSRTRETGTAVMATMLSWSRASISMAPSVEEAREASTPFTATAHCPVTCAAEVPPPATAKQKAPATTPIASRGNRVGLGHGRMLVSYSRPGALSIRHGDG